MFVCGRISYFALQTILMNRFSFLTLVDFVYSRLALFVDYYVESTDPQHNCCVNKPLPLQQNALYFCVIIMNILTCYLI